MYFINFFNYFYFDSAKSQVYELFICNDYIVYYCYFLHF